MSNPKVSGLLLIMIGALLFMGTTVDALPGEAFWAGLITYPIGGYLFFMGSRESIQKAERRAARALRPNIKNETAEKFAKAQADGIAARGTVDDLAYAARTEPANRMASRPSPSDTNQMSLELGESDALSDQMEPGKEEFKVATDVSFPLEVQERDSLADQIAKLSRLCQDGIITEEEMTIAKAKLLS